MVMGGNGTTRVLSTIALKNHLSYVRRIAHPPSSPPRSVENTACILRNLSDQLESKINPQEGAEDVLDREWELQQRREVEEVNCSFSKATPGCLAFCTFPKMSDERSKLQSVSRPIYSVDFAMQPW